MQDYGLIGNCAVSALVSGMGSIDWLCMPRPDSAPVFGRILDPEGGHFSIEPAGPVSSRRQQYIENTNVLVTEIKTTAGDAYRIIDFAPRFERNGRVFRPPSIHRVLEPLAGSPAIRVILSPVEGWSRRAAAPIRSKGALQFELAEGSLRVGTSMTNEAFEPGAVLQLRERVHFTMEWIAPGAAMHAMDGVSPVEEHLDRTIGYWRNWVKQCSIPSLFQRETIRSALALKLHCHDDTGAILAATTTSLPEEPGGSRNWDYRHCWIRDSYFVLSAFHHLGHFDEIEGFLKFLLRIAESQGGSLDRLAPVYSLDGTLPLPEMIRAAWRGHEGSAPVRTNNQAAEHIQNDAYGEMVLALSPIYFNERFVHLRSDEHDRLLARLAVLCSRSISTPDAGLWELRNGWQEHSFTNLMCWAGLERASRIPRISALASQSIDLQSEIERALLAIRRAVRDGSLRNGPTDDSFDAALSLAAVLRHPDRELSLSTIRAIQQELALGETRPLRSHLYRYRRTDDFGRPGSAFLICSFWLAQALARHGRQSEARAILEDVLRAANPVGLLAEHFDPGEGRQLGNFPQAYSHVGLINAAFAASPPWSEIL